MSGCVVWGIGIGVLSALVTWIGGWLWLRRNAATIIVGFGHGWSMHTPFLHVAATIPGDHDELVVKVRTEEAFLAFAATVANRFPSE